MKNWKKTLLCILCVAAVAAGSVMGTLAYLTDEDSAVNTFTVGKVDISLDEEAVTPDGIPTPEEDDRVQGNEYHLLPGQTYTKDPTVTVKAGSEESYVRMLVTINCYDALQEIFGGKFLPQDFVGDTWDPEVWISTGEVSVSEDGKSATYEFRYFETVDGYTTEGVEPGEDGTVEPVEKDEVLPPLFTSFTVPGTFDGEDLKKLAELKITVTGHAIQKPGFADEMSEDGTTVVKTAEDLAWEAFDAQMELKSEEEVPESSQG